MSARDKKILMLIVPVGLVAALWFLVLSPLRKDAADAAAKLSQQEARRDAAVAQAGTLAGAQASFASDYAAVVRLGKAVPSTLDLPSLIVQLDRASRGTGIDFASIRTGSAEGDASGSSKSGSSGSSSSSSSGASTSSSGSSAPGASPGGAPAQTGSGKAVEGAGEAKSGADASTSASSSAAGSAGSSSGSSSAGGSSTGSGAAASGSGSSVPGLDSVPLEFEFNASFFELTDFLHRMKRFVYVANDKIRVRGRLMTIDSINYTPDEGNRLKAEVKATVYLTPKPEGPTAGASPGGPAGASDAATSPAAPSSSSAPTATVAP